MQVNFRKWTMVGTWKYNFDFEECIICCMSYETPCSKCQKPSDCLPREIISQAQVQPRVSRPLHSGLARVEDHLPCLPPKSELWRRWQPENL